MTKVKILDVSKEFSLPDNAPLLSVHFELRDDDDKLLAERRSGFPIDASQAVIVAELSKYAEMWDADHASAAGAEALAAASAGADEVISALAGKDLSDVVVPAADDAAE